MKKLPPPMFLKFFRWYCHPKLVDSIEGDLIEDYRKRVEKKSIRIANLKFIIDVILLFRPGIIRTRNHYNDQNPFTMYKNYFKITLRIFNRERVYSLINISGLAFGFTCCLLIYLFIRDEVSYDKFHHDADRIYRISAAYMRQGVWEPYASNSWRTGELVRDSYREIEELVRIMPDNGALFEYGDKKIVEDRFAWVDDNFFNVFNFPLVEGNGTEALKGPNKIVISESTAAKYFGSENAMGKLFKGYDGQLELQVSAVMKDMPPNSHFHFDFLISNATLRQIAPESLFTNVGWDSQHLYAKLAPGADAARMEATFPDFIDKNFPFWKSTSFRMFVQPLTSIHLESNIGLEIEPNGSMTHVYIFSVIAVFILAIACVNYMNLTTARSMRRSKEVGMRKVLGANRPDLLGQFLTESFITTAIAVVLALVATVALLPEFNSFTGKEISQRILFSQEIIVTLFLSLIAIALISGFYPAFVLSSFKPLNSMKGSGAMPTSGFAMRRGLVLLQFVISIGLIAASAIVFQQWDFLKNKSLGINKEMVIVVPLQTMDRRQVATFGNELLTNASIRKTGFSNMRMPGWIGNSTRYTAQDVEPDNEVNKTMKLIRIDYDFLATIEAEMRDGRNFSREFHADTLSSVIINESAVAQLGWKDAIGKWMEFEGRRFTVVGVVKDFHFESLHRKIPPTLFIFSPQTLNWAYLKIDGENVRASLAHVETTYSKFVENRDFTFSFLNEDIERQYETEEKFTFVFSMFTVLAIVIACLGTFGLISFTAERKSKEIGIRKVLGASAGNLSFMLIREFVILLAIASVIAWPITWYFLEGWVDGFIYKITIGVGPFVLSTALAGVIVVLTTGFRAMKAALMNPVNSLRME